MAQAKYAKLYSDILDDWCNAILVKKYYLCATGRGLNSWAGRERKRRHLQSYKMRRIQLKETKTALCLQKMRVSPILTKIWRKSCNIDGVDKWWWWWHVARIISVQKIYGLYGLKRSYRSECDEYIRIQLLECPIPALSSVCPRVTKNTDHFSSASIPQTWSNGFLQSL